MIPTSASVPIVHMRCGNDKICALQTPSTYRDFFKLRWTVACRASTVVHYSGDQPEYVLFSC